jgi:hypothetical protein
VGVDSNHRGKIPAGLQPAAFDRSATPPSEIGALAKTTPGNAIHGPVGRVRLLSSDRGTPALTAGKPQRPATLVLG